MSFQLRSVALKFVERAQSSFSDFRRFEKGQLRTEGVRAFKTFATPAFAQKRKYWSLAMLVDQGLF